MKDALDRRHVQRGTGYYVRPPQSKSVYVVWKDSKCIPVMSTAYPGHSTNTIKRRIKDQVSGFSEVVNVTIPEAVEGYNTYMGGVDKSDQFISYNRILRKTVRYWKTMFYHLLEIIVTNSSILYNWNRMTAGMKRVSQTQFRDTIIQQIISRYGKPVVAIESFTISHGSIYNDEHSKKEVCFMPYTKHNQTMP